MEGTASFVMLSAVPTVRKLQKYAQGNSSYERELAGLDANALNECKFGLSKIVFGYDNLLLWLSLLGLASALLESYLHHLEHKFAERRTYLRFLRQTYKELVILGFLSFVLILLRDFYPNMTKNAFLIVEMAHLWLFSVGIAFVVVAIQISIGLVSSKRRWDTAFAHGLPVIEAEYSNYHGSAGYCRYVFCFLPAMFYGDRLLEQTKLWIMRKQFVQANHLPSTFDFPKYLRRTLTVNMLKGVEIGWQSWSVICVLFFIGFGIASTMDTGDRTMNIDVAGLIGVGLTLAILLVASRMNAIVNSGTNRYFRLQGCDRPHEFRSLMDFAKYLHEREELQHRSLILHGFTHDDLRLQQILREGRDNKTLTDAEITANNSIFGSTRGSSQFEKHVTLFSPTAFVIAFRMFVLMQCYVIGLFFVLYMGHSGYSSLFVALTFCELVLHFLLIGIVLPDLIRGFSLIGSVLILSEQALDRIEDTFQFHAATNLAVQQLTMLLFKEFQHSAYELFPKSLTELSSVEVEEAIEAMWKGLNPRNYQRVRSHMLSKRLHGRMRARRIKLVFRALSTPRGLTIDECKFLVKNMIVIHTESEDIDRNLKLCFGAANVKCGLCGTMIPSEDLKIHATAACPQLPDSTSITNALEIATPMPAIQSLLARIADENEVSAMATKYGLLQPHFDHDLWPDDDEEESVVGYPSSVVGKHKEVSIPFTFDGEDI